MRSPNVCGILLLLLTALSLTYGVKAAGQRREVQTYQNRRYHYCFEFPATWKLQESDSENGAMLGPGDQDGYKTYPTMIVGGYSDQPSEQNEGQMQSLEENVQQVIESLRQSEGVGELRLVDKDQVSLSGVRAIVFTVTYKDSKSGKEWFSKDLTAIDEGQIVYFVELKCDPKDEKLLLPIFDQIIRSFKLSCKDSRENPA